MFVLEDNKVVFVSTDLIVPENFEEDTDFVKVKILDIYPSDLYGCACKSSYVQTGVYSGYTYYTEHDKENHILNSMYVCPKCSTELKDLNLEFYDCSCGIKVEIVGMKFVIWD